jgi:kinetochore protein Nuf2
MDVTGGLHTFSFPLLKNAEILTCLSEAGIALTESELMEPQRHRDNVKSTFCSLVHLGLGHNEEHFITLGETLSQQVMSNPNLAHKELHADASSLSELKFFLACKKFMRICGIATDFGMSDLSSPTSKRFRKQLSAAINFIKFREEKLEVYAELQEQRDDILNGLNDVQDEQVALQQTLDQAKEDAAQRWEQVQEVEQEVSELEKEISSQNKHQSSIRQESTLLKKQAKDLKDKMDTTQLELAKLESHERKLLPQIVHSPKEIQSKILALKQSLMEERKECDAAKRQAQIRNAKVTQIGQGIHLVNKLKEELNLVGEEQGKMNKVQQDCQVIQDVVDKNEAKTAELKEGCSVQERELQYIGKILYYDYIFNSLHVEDGL